MILSGNRIKEEVQKKNLIIAPYDLKNVGPNSYNLSLHHELAVYDLPVLDMKAAMPLRRFSIPAEGLVLQPNHLYLGRTIEYTETKGFVPMLEGRSSVGRLGLSVHVTAGFGDVGFRGYWTLEISTLHPIRIYAGVGICQIIYHEISGVYDEYSSSKYQDNRDLQPSLLYKELTV